MCWRGTRGSLGADGVRCNRECRSFIDYLNMIISIGKERRHRHRRVRDDLVRVGAVAAPRQHHRLALSPDLAPELTRRRARGFIVLRESVLRRDAPSVVAPRPRPRPRPPSLVRRVRNARLPREVERELLPLHKGRDTEAHRPVRHPQSVRRHERGEMEGPVHVEFAVRIPSPIGGEAAQVRRSKPKGIGEKRENPFSARSRPRQARRRSQDGRRALSFYPSTRVRRKATVRIQRASPEGIAHACSPRDTQWQNGIVEANVNGLRENATRVPRRWRNPRRGIVVERGGDVLK